MSGKEIPKEMRTYPHRDERVVRHDNCLLGVAVFGLSHIKEGLPKLHLHQQVRPATTSVPSQVCSQLS